MERIRLTHAFRRYWAAELWGDVFNSLLNLPDARTRPPCARLAQRILDHLAAHPGLQQRAQAELAQQASRPPLACVSRVVVFRFLNCIWQMLCVVLRR